MPVTALDLLDSAPLDDAPRTGSDRTMVAVARVLSASADGTSVTVSMLGSAPITLPATPASWSAAATAHVLIDPDTARPLHVLGPAPAPKSPMPAVFTDIAPSSTTTTVTRTVQPEWTGTHHAALGWDRFGVIQHGGHRDLYQGRTGTHQLTSLALYGRQVPAIGASKITTATLTVTGNTATPGSWTAVVQAADYTETGPAVSGPTATGVVTGATTTDINVTALAAGLLEGRGLALVGSAFGAVAGVGASMVLTLECAVPA